MRYLSISVYLFRKSEIIISLKRNEKSIRMSLKGLRTKNSSLKKYLYFIQVLKARFFRYNINVQVFQIPLVYLLKVTQIKIKTIPFANKLRSFLNDQAGCYQTSKDLRFH